MITLGSVLQNSLVDEGFSTGGEESKPISNELASTINDGLYFYEQVGKSIPFHAFSIVFVTYTILTYKLLAGTEN